jgi:hypothetical protein
MVLASSIPSKESQDASLFQRVYMEIDLRLEPAADLGLPAICDFQKAVAAERQMPDAVVVAVVIVK